MPSQPGCHWLHPGIEQLQSFLNGGAWQDALLHPNLPLLAFLMAATAKGYTLGRTLASACLRIVHDLAVVPVQDQAPKGEAVVTPK